MRSNILLVTLGLCFIFITGFKDASSTKDLPTVKEQLEKELIPLAPKGAGGMVALFKPGEEAQFITLGKTSVNNGALVNKDTLSLIKPT
jgi:hypothetical protein